MSPRRPRRDFEDEIRAHLELEEARLREEGMTAEEARAAARKAFGNVLQAQERYYHTGRFRMFAQFWFDVRAGFRQLRTSTGFAVLAIGTMALAIAANTALFTVVHAVLLKPLPYADAERLARVWMDNRRLQMREDWASWLNYQDYKRLGTSFDLVAAFSEGAANLTGDGEPEPVRGIRAEREVFDVLGVTPLRGRLFTKEEEQDGKNAVWLISWQLWQRRFGGREDVIGKKVDLDGQSVTVIGVMPASFRFPAKTTDFWTPLVVPERAKRRGGYWLQMVAKTKPGVTMETAQTQMALVGQQLEQQYPKENAGYGVFVNPLLRHEVGDTRTPLLILTGAVGFVLLIACVNVAGLLLARAETRGREVALRAALGAGRARLLLLMLAESMSLALFAGAIGVACAWAGVRVLTAVAPADLPRLNEIAINWQVLLFALAVTLLTAVLAGLAPSWRLSRLDLNSAIRDGGRSVAGSHGAQRTRGILIAGECMLAVMLLVGAALMLRSLGNLRAVDPGYRTDVLTLRVQASRARGADRAQVVEFYRQLFERVKAIPGVDGVSTISTLLLSETPNSGTFTLEDRPPLPEAEQIEATIDAVGPGFFESMRVPLKWGRGFDDRDGPNAPRAAVINEMFADRYWPGQNPVGKRFVFGTPSERNPWITIVGVARDMHRRGLHRPARLEVLTPATQNPRSGMQLLVTRAGAGSPLALASSVRREIRALDASAPVTEVMTVEENVGESLQARRFQTLLLALFAGLALLLAAVGIFALMYHTVNQRTQEIGVRMALGAQPGEVVGMIVRRGMVVTGIGIGLGIVGAIALSRAVRALLFGVTPVDPLSYVAAAILLGGVALLACWAPATRSARVDPMIALRHE